jgi:hypothetical protein
MTNGLQERIRAWIPKGFRSAHVPTSATPRSNSPLTICSISIVRSVVHILKTLLGVEDMLQPGADHFTGEYGVAL